MSAAWSPRDRAAVLLWPAGRPGTSCGHRSRSRRRLRGTTARFTDGSRRGRPRRRRRRRPRTRADLLRVVEAVLPALEAGLTPGAALGLAAEVAPGGERERDDRCWSADSPGSAPQGLPIGPLWAQAAAAAQSPELRLLAQAWSLTEDLGAPLAEAVRTTAGLLRARIAGRAPHRRCGGRRPRHDERPHGPAARRSARGRWRSGWTRASSTPGRRSPAVCLVAGGVLVLGRPLVGGPDGARGGPWSGAVVSVWFAVTVAAAWLLWPARRRGARARCAGPRRGPATPDRVLARAIRPARADDARRATARACPVGRGGQRHRPARAGPARRRRAGRGGRGRGARLDGPAGAHLHTVAAAERWGVGSVDAWASVPSAWQPAARALRMAATAGIAPADVLARALRTRSAAPRSNAWTSPPPGSGSGWCCRWACCSFRRSSSPRSCRSCWRSPPKSWVNPDPVRRDPAPSEGEHHDRTPRRRPRLHPQGPRRLVASPRRA